MTYQSGSPIQASARDLNDFLTAVKAIYGVGTGDHGYGQTAINQAAVSVGDLVRSVHWTNLRSMIVTCANHQGVIITYLPSAAVFAVGQTIFAYAGDAYEFRPDLNGADEPLGGLGSSTAYEFLTDYNGSDQVTGLTSFQRAITLPIYINAIETNRLNVAPTALSVVSNVWSITRSATWSLSIDAEVSTVWPSEDAARAYFNSGGEIRLRGSHPGGGAQAVHWNTTLVNGLGTLKFAAHSTSNTGSISGSATIGYYELTNTYQTIFAGNTSGSTGSTSGNSIVIAAKRVNYSGVRGGNGAGVQFQITLTDSGFYYTVVNVAGVTFAFDNVKATTFLSGITSPTYTTIDPF